MNGHSVNGHLYLDRKLHILSCVYSMDQLAISIDGYHNHLHFHQATPKIKARKAS
jgi:hypothetical protein